MLLVNIHGGLHSEQGMLSVNIIYTENKVAYTHVGVSNPGLEYGMEWWNGKWSGTVNAHNYSCVTGAILQGWASHYVSRALHHRGCRSKSSVASILLGLASWCHGQKLGIPTYVHCSIPFFHSIICSFPYSSPAIWDTWVQLAVVYDLQVSVSVLWKMIHHRNKMFRQALCSGY